MRCERLIQARNIAHRGDLFQEGCRNWPEFNLPHHMDFLKIFSVASLGETTSILIISTLIIATTITFYFGTTYILKKAALIRVPDREVLKAVYDAGGGPSWDAKYSENWCKSDKKLSEWAGIEAGFAHGHEHALEVIMRGNKKFTGMLYEILSRMT